MAGKTGTAAVIRKAGGVGKYYASSFVGYFPAEEPKYSCIVVVHKPSTALNYYGAMLRVRFSRELHKKYLPMRLQQMKLKFE
jgi:cell division protein FtsI/penicillin-binding protein 2